MNIPASRVMTMSIALLQAHHHFAEREAADGDAAPMVSSSCMPLILAGWPLFVHASVHSVCGVHAGRRRNRRRKCVSVRRRRLLVMTVPL